MSEEKKHKPLFAQQKPDEELKQIAMDLYDGKIFCDRHLSHENTHEMQSIFMPLALGGLSKVSEHELKEIGLIFEYLEKSGPSSINGKPCFFSMNLLSQDETKKMLAYYDEYKSLKDKFQKV